MIIGTFQPDRERRVIYALIDPRNGDIRYIGQTINPMVRYVQHQTTKKDIEFVTWWREVLADGFEVPMYLICECTDKAEADRDEFYTMRLAMDYGHELFNIAGTRRKPPKEQDRVVRSRRPPRVIYMPIVEVPPPVPVVRPLVQARELTYCVPFGTKALNDPRLGYKVPPQPSYYYG